MKNKDKIKNLLDEEHCGFAITLEVLATLFMFFVFLNFILYFTRVMDVQRFMNTVMTSTAEQASRWGGVNSSAYKQNISETPLLETAKDQLNYVAKDFNPTITGTPNKIENDGDKITIKITYSLPPVFNTMSTVSSINSSEDLYNINQRMSMQISVNSIMEAGKLL